MYYFLIIIIPLIIYDNKNIDNSSYDLIKINLIVNTFLNYYFNKN